MKKNANKNVKSDFLVDSIVLTRSKSQNFVSDLNNELDKLLSFIASAPPGFEVIEIKIYKSNINH